VDINEGRYGPPCQAVLVDYDRKADLSTLDITLDDTPTSTIDIIVEAIGSEVINSKRIEFATLKLRDLKKGDWRSLNSGEVDRLKAFCVKIDDRRELNLP
jgi:16S rRNA U516 pseudouridylate synthase RsuA-like enzyme